MLSDTRYRDAPDFAPGASFKKVRALFFGEQSTQHFGLVFQPTPRQSPVGLLICKPIGQEDIRTHKAVIQLGREMASQGAVAMAFDYYGTGDSAGKFEDVSLSSCVAGIEAAAAYLRDQCGCQSIVLLGIRAGALFADQAAQRVKPAATVLWHPVLDGKGYLKEIRGQHRKWLLGSFVRKNGRFKEGSEILGFRYNKRLTREISKLRIDPAAAGRRDACLLITRPANGAADAGGPGRLAFLPSKYTNFWIKNETEDALVPIHDIKAIAGWIASTTQQPARPGPEHHCPV